MRLGTITYASQQGLGYLAKSFYDAGIVTDVLVVEHSSRESKHKEWYPNAPVIKAEHLGTSQASSVINKFIERMDAPGEAAMLFFETPFDWSIIPKCRRLGIKTILMPMYECTPKVLPEVPDKFLNPSLLDQRYYPSGKFIPIPVEVEWRQKTVAKTFIHNAGHGGLRGRNGTKELVEALQYVESDAKFIIRTQTKRIYDEIQDEIARVSNKVDVHLSCSTIPFEKLYEEGDVFVFPEKFNGLSLPLQESYAAGMCVLSTNRFPMNTWLPDKYLIPVQGFKTSCLASHMNDFQEAIIDPKEIAKMIDSVYGTDIGGVSEQGKLFAEKMSWETLKPQYLEYLKEDRDAHIVSCETR